jgi:hypothetical protein
MEKGLETIEKEIAGEKAAALGRSGRKLRSALDKLRRFDESSRRSREGDARARLIEAEYIRKEYAVPPEVWQHMRPKLDAAHSRSLSD